MSHVYNYSTFDSDYVARGCEAEEFAAWPTSLHAGERAPDGELTRLSDGAGVRLGDLWTTKGIVLEFGSFT